MFKKSRYINVYNHRHSFLWWLFIGWWWRPLKFLFWFTLAIFLGFKIVKFLTK